MPIVALSLQRQPKPAQQLWASGLGPQPFSEGQ